MGTDDMTSRRAPWIIASAAVLVCAGGLWWWTHRGPAEAAANPAVPVELQGTWCTRSGDSPYGGPDGDPCFSAAALLTQYPGMTFRYVGDDADMPGAVQVWGCFEMDLGDTCSMAASIFLAYFPAGTSWDCQEYADKGEWPGCDPDFTSAHDTDQARLVILPNHQQGDLYVDTEPMYQRQS
jgi:hypothetical protein